MLGRDCPYSWFRPLTHFSLGLSCTNLANTDLEVSLSSLLKDKKPRGVGSPKSEHISHTLCFICAIFRWLGLIQDHFPRQTCLCPPRPPPPTAAPTRPPPPPFSGCWAPPASPPGGRSLTFSHSADGLPGSTALARSTSQLV